MSVERHADIYFLPVIDNPSEEQIDYFTIKAAVLDDVIEAGGMTAEQAAFERGLALGRIGMGNMFKKVEQPELPFDDDIA
jgi:hypothetical protein